MTVVCAVAERRSTWTVWRRFKEFRALHTALKKHVRGLPSFPSRKPTFFSSTSSTVVSSRSAKLQAYLQVPRRPDGGGADVGGEDRILRGHLVDHP